MVGPAAQVVPAEASYAEVVDLQWWMCRQMAEQVVPQSLPAVCQRIEINAEVLCWREWQRCVRRALAQGDPGLDCELC